MWNYPVRSSLLLSLLGMPLSESGLDPGRAATEEPVDRFISAYKYVLKTAHHRVHDEVVNGGISREEYVETFWI